MEKKFNILTIDGGGIRGIFPAMFLAYIEAELKSRGVEKYRIYQNFQLISGTSTGGDHCNRFSIRYSSSRNS